MTPVYTKIWKEELQELKAPKIIGSNSRYQKGVASSSKNELEGGKADTICIAYKSKANTNKLMHGT